MNMVVASGALALVGGLANLAHVVRRKGEKFEYVGALFMSEFGLVTILSQLGEPGTGRLVVTLLLGTGALATMCYWLWLIVAYFRERLFVTMDAITQHGCIARRRINVPDVIQIVWKGIPQVGKIIIRSHFTKI